MAKIVLEDDDWIRYKCPGCKHDHTVPAKRWNFNNDIMKPTLNPSVRHFYTIEGKEITTCHYFIRDGMIQYCSDCQHELAGMTVEMENI
jgi:hypothetical protein